MADLEEQLSDEEKVGVGGAVTPLPIAEPRFFPSPNPALPRPSESAGRGTVAVRGRPRVPARQPGAGGGSAGGRGAGPARGSSRRSL